MSDFRSLMKQPSENELQKEEKYLKQSYENSLKHQELWLKAGDHPMYSHYFNSAYIAVRMRNEALLDEIQEWHEQTNGGGETFPYHIKFNRACLRVSQHRFEEAIQMLKELEAEDRNIHRSHILHLLLDIYNHQNDYISAAAYVHKYFAHWVWENRNHPSHSGPYCFIYYSGFPDLLEILSRAHEHEKVIEYGLERIKIKIRDDRYVYFLVAYSYQQLHDLKNALKHYRYIFRKKHPYPEAYINVGNYYGLVLKDKANQIKYYIGALKHCSNNPMYSHLLSALFFELGRIYKELDHPEKVNAFRRKSFDALPKPLLSDLFMMFSYDPDAIDLYEDWLKERLDASENQEPQAAGG